MWNEEDLTVQNLYKANKVQQKRIKELEAEAELLSKNFNKYGVHLYICRHKDICKCGFDEAKEQSLEVMVRSHSEIWALNHQNMQFEERIKELKNRIEALEQLLVCYRIGKPPTEKLHKMLDETKQALKERG